MKRLLAILLALLMLLTATSCAATTADAPETLTLLALNVGKADALLLSSGDTVYLIDTGTEESWADLARALTTLGITHLTGVIVTHMDKDHYGGAEQLAESEIAVDGWYASWAWEKDKWKKHPLVKAAAIRNESVTLLYPGDTLSDGLLTVLGPLQERGDSENDNSLVLLASGGGGKMLLTGDMEYDEENDLLSAGVIPRCEVLKVGHHGRDDATSAALVSAVRPQIAVISTSTAVLPESPARKVLNLLSGVGAQIVQTQQATLGVRVTLRDGSATAELLND